MKSSAWIAAFFAVFFMVIACGFVWLAIAIENYWWLLPSGILAIWSANLIETAVDKADE